MIGTRKNDDDGTRCAMLPQGLSCALDFAPIGIFVTDPNKPGNPIAFVNQEFERITGYGRHEASGHGLDLLNTDLPSRVAASATSRETITDTLVNHRKSGEPFFMKIEVRPVFDADDRLEAFVGGVMDMTDQHLAQEALAESEERLRAVMIAIPLPMLTLRLDGRIARANTAAHETLRVPPNSLPGRSVFDFIDQDTPARAGALDELDRAGFVAKVEMQATRADGGQLWTLVSAKRYTVRGETRTLVVFQDVTELKLKERALTEANEEAERNIRARMRFLAAASHDLRQPLQAMALFASALEHHVATPQGRTIVTSLKTSLRGMEEMFDSLLDMSKLDAGVMKAETSVFLVNDIIEQIEMTYAGQAEAAGLEFRVVPSSAVVRSDRRLLARIIGNFVSNAIRYTRKGRVLLGVRHRGDRIRVCVIDTGPGIPEDQRLEIFREFRQGNNGAGRERGTGLGLAIVQRLSLLLNHPLDVRSKTGRGSNFSVEVPLADEDMPGFADDEADEDMRDVGGATVLVVDDDRDIQDGLGMLLHQWGCRPIITASGEEALAAMDDQHAVPDVILADVHLHEHGSGLTAIQQIRARAGHDVAAFLFTGDTEYPTEVGDHVRVLRKPLDPLRLRTMLADALGR
ncbi:MAG TPA: PAS domain-containing protein [Candidatus Omnitrophota bacterium]|nr:PAS domain-containing protein [Candidatus Omnitrophota bacterium]